METIEYQGFFDAILRLRDLENDTIIVMVRNLKDLRRYHKALTSYLSFAVKSFYVNGEEIIFDGTKVQFYIVEWGKTFEENLCSLKCQGYNKEKTAFLKTFTHH